MASHGFRFSGAARLISAVALRSRQTSAVRAALEQELAHLGQVLGRSGAASDRASGRTLARDIQRFLSRPAGAPLAAAPPNAPPDLPPGPRIGGFSDLEECGWTLPSMAR